MSCAFPRWRIDMEKAKVFLPYEYEKRIHNKGVLINRDEFEYLSWKIPLVSNFIRQIPCGQCIGCRLAYSRNWANRCMLEASFYEANCFVTLTYDDEHLPYQSTVDEITGEIESLPSLVPKHLQDFLKRLRIYFQRKYNSTDIRFFACGEYGELYERPHYHIILFNCDFFDKELYSIRNGQKLYISKELLNLWSFGYSTVGSVSWDSCAYTARYIMKKQIGKSAVKKNRVPEFVRMSRRPGIARQYYEFNKDKIYNTDEVIVQKGNDVISVKPPIYFDKLFDLDNHDRLLEIKFNRLRNADVSNHLTFKNTDVNPYDYGLLREDSKRKSIEKLVRTLEE